MNVIDLPQRHRSARSSFRVEVFDGSNFAGCGCPSFADARDLKLHVFQSREFLQIWTGTIGRANGIQSYLLLIRNGDGEPVLYLPLAIETAFNIRILRFMDYGVADYNGPVLKTGVTLAPDEFRPLWTQALSLLPDVDVVDLKKIAGDVAGAVNPLTFLDCTAHAEDGHALSLKRSDSAVSAGQQKKLDREYRKLGEHGAVELVVNPGGELAATVTEKLFALKRKKYAQTGVPDFLAAPGVADFYRHIVNAKIGHLSALTIGDTVVAAHLGYTGRRRFYYILPAYDAAYARYRPGHLLLRELVARSVQQDDETFDFGAGDETYKQTWADHRLPLYDHECAMTAAGRVYLQMRRVRRFVKSRGARLRLPR